MTDNPRPTFEMAIDTRLLYERLKEASIGETVTYDELDNVIGRSVRNGAYSNLASARRRLLKTDGIVFGTVQKVGLQRLDDEGIVATAEAQLGRLRRGARRAGSTLACVRDFDGLGTEQQTKHNAAMSLFGAVAKITQTNSVKRLEGEVRKAGKALPLARTLEMFSQ